MIDSNTCYVAGSYGTILKTINGGFTTSVEENPNSNSFIPENIFLSQNYPNPFNPSTKISFSITHPGLVTLKIYDILGTEIETLVYEEKPAGSYEINWNASRLSSGVYFYQLKAGDFTSVKKMILLK